MLMRGKHNIMGLMETYDYRCEHKESMTIPLQNLAPLIFPPATIHL